MPPHVYMHLYAYRKFLNTPQGIHIYFKYKAYPMQHTEIVALTDVTDIFSRNDYYP